MLADGVAAQAAETWLGAEAAMAKLRNREVRGVAAILALMMGRIAALPSTELMAY